MYRPLCLAFLLLVAPTAALAQAPAAPPDQPPAGAPPAAPPPPTPAAPPAAAPAAAPAAVPAAPAAAAPTPAPTGVPTITGFVDATYNYNINRPADGLNRGFSYNYHHNNFTLNNAHVALNGDFGNGLTYVIETDAGNDAVIDSSNFLPPPDAPVAPGTTTSPYPYRFDVQEAYGVYKMNTFGIKFGKFVTFNGIEVIESPSNPTVSRGYLFGLAEPFTHTGFVLFDQVTDQVIVNVGVINGWDVVADNNRAKTIVAAVGINPDPSTTITLSAYFGPEQTNNNSNWRETVDLTALRKISIVDLWLQGNYGHESNAVASGAAKWFGFGLQPLIHFSDQATLGIRAEYFKDSDGARTGLAQGLFNISVAPGYAPNKHFLFRAEARADISNQQFYIDKDGAPKKNQIDLLGEAVAIF